MKHLSLLAVMISGLWCCQPQARQSYTPAYADQWAQVESHILQTWHQSRVDSNSWRMPGALALPHPFYTIRPGRHVLFYWDVYFTNAGLLMVDSLIPYAKNAVDNQLWEVDSLGYIPNANEPWALNRSQSPFLSMMVRNVFEHTHDTAWLRQAYPTLLQEYHFWTDTAAQALEDHTTAVPGLQRFYHHATEAELLQFYAQLAPRFGFADTLAEAEKLTLAHAWMAEAETGMDFTPRFENRCPDFIAIDLNASLYRYEINFAWMDSVLQRPSTIPWTQRAATRKALLTQYCWDDTRGLFMDYDFKHQRFSQVASLASFYPLWAGLATAAQARRTVENLARFEYPYGPAVCEQTHQPRAYQWDYPAGWPPLYLLVAQGLHRYGYQAHAKRIAARYLDVVTKNFIQPQPLTYRIHKDGQHVTETRAPGAVYEKYDVVTGQIYDAEYPSRAFQGWSYGVYIWCINFYRSP